MKRRSLALLLGLAMLFTLAACGTSRPSAQSVTQRMPSKPFRKLT